MTNLTIKSFANNIATVSYGTEYYDKEIIVPDEYVIDGVLDESVFLLYATGFTADRIEQIALTQFTDTVDYGITKIHLPNYITQQTVVGQIDQLVSSGKIILDSINPDYVIRLDKTLDILEHQNLTSPLTDNYIYFYNRVLFLRHLRAFSLSFGADIIEPIKYIVPTSLTQIESFIQPDTDYLVYQSLDFDNAITVTSNNILQYFDHSKISQNINNSNFISMRSNKQSWCIEQHHTHEHAVRGYTFRSPNLRATDHAIGINMKYDNIIENDRIKLSNFIGFTFYFYGTPFLIKYKKVNDKLLILDMDLSIHVDNPRIEQIYTSSNIPD